MDIKNKPINSLSADNNIHIHIMNQGSKSPFMDIKNLSTQ